MKTIAYIAIVVGVLSLIVGVGSRITINPINFQGLIPGDGLSAQAFLAFANTCLLTAITFLILQIAKGKQ